MVQLDLFDAQPRARASDPVTSHEAADKAEAEGTIGRQAQEVLECVRRFPGQTSIEYGQLLGWAGARWAAARRLPELERAGLVHRGPKRTYTVAFRETTGVTWWLTKKGALT